VTLRSAHEGAPGRSHGGIVSALFDDVFGFILTIYQQPGFTGELTIRYERGVPLHQPLECRVRLDDREGRKLYMTGELSGTDDDGERVVYTRARATFIAIDRERFAVGGG
jgi:acyl-coenzyme A thioesterase PaaI-like protein